MDKKDLFILAKEAMKNSYAPYSNYNVGAVLLTKNGNIYKGCNIENASYTPTVCAERTAIFTAVHNGEREFEAIAIVGGHKGDIKGVTAPCGVCRQVMGEFCSPDFYVIWGNDENMTKKTLGEILPFGFDKNNL